MLSRLSKPPKVLLLPLYFPCQTVVVVLAAALITFSGLPNRLGYCSPDAALDAAEYELYYNPRHVAAVVVLFCYFTVSHPTPTLDSILWNRDNWDVNPPFSLNYIQTGGQTNKQFLADHQTMAIILEVVQQKLPFPCNIKIYVDLQHIKNFIKKTNFHAPK